MAGYKNPQDFSVSGSGITEDFINALLQALSDALINEPVAISVYNGEMSSPQAITQLEADVARGSQILIKYEEVRHLDVDTRNSQVDEECLFGIYCCYADYSDFDLTGKQIGGIFQIVRRVMGIVLSTRFIIKPDGNVREVKSQARPEGILEMVNQQGLVVQRALFSIRYSTDYSTFV